MRMVLFYSQLIRSDPPLFSGPSSNGRSTQSAVTGMEGVVLDDAGINEEDVVKLIMQFCKEKGFTSSLDCLHQESGVSASFQQENAGGLSIGEMITRGDWVKLLPTLQSMSLPEGKLVLLYEQVLFELLESGEVPLAQELLMSTRPLSDLQHSNKAHFNKLHALCFTNERWNATLAYDMGGSKERRRQEIRDAIESELVVVPPSRLLTLLGYSLKYLESTGAVAAGSRSYDLFRGGVREADKRDVDERVVGRAVAQLPFEVESKIESVAFHPDGTCMALGGTDGFIELRDCEEGALMKDLQYQAKDMFMRHEQGVMCMAFGGKENSAGEMLTSGCQAGCVKVWKVANGACLRKFPNAHTCGVTSVCFSRGGSQVLSTSLDGTIKCLGIRSGNILREYRGPSSAGVLSACFSQDYSQVFSVAADGFLRCWESKTAENLFEVVPGADVAGSDMNRQEVESRRAAIVRVQVAPSGGLFVCSQGDRAYMLNAQDGSTIMSYSAGKTSAQKGDFLCGTISAQGHYVYAAAEDGRLYSFDTKTGYVHSTVELASHGAGAKTVGLERARETLGVEHHPSRNLLVTFSAAGSLVLWRP